MTYWVDALPKQTATYTIDDPTKQTLTGLTVANIPADGKNNHVLCNAKTMIIPFRYR